MHVRWDVREALGTVRVQVELENSRQIATQIIHSRRPLLHKIPFTQKLISDP